MFQGSWGNIMGTGEEEENIFFWCALEAIFGIAEGSIDVISKK